MDKVLGGLKVVGLGLAVLAFLGGLLLAWMYGLVWATHTLRPWLATATGWLLVVVVLILIPLSLLKVTRGFAAGALMLASYVFGVTLWLQSFLVVAHFWSLFWAFVGLFMFFGVVPFALLAAGFAAEWEVFWVLVLLVVATFGSRGLGAWLFVRTSEQSEVA